MHVCVIGGAGFVGSHLVDRLLAEGDTVDVVDDLSTGSLANLAAARAVSSGALKFHHLDARADELGDVLARRPPDVVYHLAALPPGRGGRSTVEAALGTTLQVLDTAQRLRVGKVIVTLPGGALYGPVPSRELPVKEGRAGEPASITGIAARAMVELCTLYRAVNQLEFTALATGSVYGTRQRPDGGVVAALLDRLVRGEAPVIEGDGRQTRDFVFIDDVVDALVRAGRRGSGLVVNVATGLQTSIGEVCRLLSRPGDATPVGAPARAGERGRFSLSVVRARIHLGWEPWTTLPDGVRALSESSGRS